MMKHIEILDYILIIFEEDPEILVSEILTHLPNLQASQVSGYSCRGGYKELIKAIAEIKGEYLHL